PVKIGDVADVVDGLENTKVGAWYRGQPSIVVDVQRQPGANVIETVQGIHAELARLRRAAPTPSGRGCGARCRPPRPSPLSMTAPRRSALPFVTFSSRSCSASHWWCSSSWFSCELSAPPLLPALRCPCR